MKNTFIFSICILIFGCSKLPEKQIIVAGSIDDSKVSIVKLSTADSTYIDTVRSGHFSFSIPTTTANYVDLKIGKKIPLYLEPSDSIFVEYTNKNYLFSGLGFEESKFLYKKGELINKLGFNDPRKIDIELFSSETDLFRAKIDSIKKIRITQIEDFKGQYPNISDSFCKIEKELIDYFVINQLFSYPGFHEMLTKNKPNLSDNYYHFTTNIQPDRKELYSFNEYKSAINKLLDYKTELFTDKYFLAKEILTDGHFFVDIMYRNFHRHINFNGIDGIDSICIDFITHMKDEEQKGNLKSKYDSWRNLAKGEKAPNFEIKDDKGRLVKLSDFKGRIVYVDCWSSYCGPCIAEMPSMKKLSEEFINKDIVFVSISADKDIDRWLNKLREFDLNTINLCTEGARHKFNNDYNAKAFPRYILIDEEGIIIDATADKPSMIKEELEKLLL